MFFVMAFGLHLLRAMIAQHEAKRALPLLNNHSTFNILSYEEGEEFCNSMILLIWQKLSNTMISWKTNMRTNLDRPKSTELFGLCGLYTLLLGLMCFICASMCKELHCLYLIGW